MPSRREFIQAGLAVSVAPLALPIRDAVSLAPHAEITAPSHHALHCVVCDVRFRWSTDLAHEARRLGVAVTRTNGDITDFWFTDLSQRWKKTPVAIAGLTAHGPLFCLERFAWDHGLRVVFRGTHRVLDTGHVEHALEGPFHTIAAAHENLADADWPGHLARLLHSCAAARDTASTTVKAALPHGGEDDLHETLYSWVIAPKHAEPVS